MHIILPTKTTAAKNEVALSYDRVRGLYFLAVVFVATITYMFMYNCHVGRGGIFSDSYSCGDCN